MRWPARLVVALAGLTLLGATVGVLCAEGPARRARGTDEYRIAYWPADEEQAQIAAKAAALAIQRLQHALNATLQRRIEIELCHTNREFNERTGENNPLWIQGRAFPREYRIVVKALGPRRIGTLVAHEIVHVLLQRKLDETGAPTLRWLHEGLAKYVTGDLPMDDQQLLVHAATQGRLLTLDELEPAFSGKLEQVSLAYAQSYTLVEYLTSLEGKTGLSGFLAELGHVKDVDRALVRAYQMPVAQLEADWLRHINRLYLGRRGPNVFGDWLWGAVSILFIIALVVQLRRSRIIRRRMQEEELLSQIMAEDISVETEVEEAE